MSYRVALYLVVRPQLTRNAPVLNWFQLSAKASRLKFHLNQSDGLMVHFIFLPYVEFASGRILGVNI